MATLSCAWYLRPSALPTGTPDNNAAKPTNIHFKEKSNIFLETNFSTTFVVISSCLRYMQMNTQFYYFLVLQIPTNDNYTSCKVGDYEGKEAKRKKENRLISSLQAASMTRFLARPCMTPCMAPCNAPCMVGMKPCIMPCMVHPRVVLFLLFASHHAWGLLSQTFGRHAWRHAWRLTYGNSFLIFFGMDCLKIRTWILHHHCKCIIVEQRILVVTVAALIRVVGKSKCFEYVVFNAFIIKSM